MLRRLLLCLALAAVGCRPSPPPMGAPSERIFPVRGVVQRTKPERGTVVIAHGAIAGYMDAMTMEFALADGAAAHTLRPGDVVTFQLHVTPSHSWAGEIVVVESGKSPPYAEVEPEESDITPVGQSVPEVHLIDAAGQAITPGGNRGDVLALTFIFTRCPLPDFCPRMVAHFAEVQRDLASTGATGWRLLSVSIDPSYDTPERLSAYAAGANADPVSWTFATGSPEEIERLAQFFGLQIRRGATLPQHNLRTVVIDRSGKVRRVFTGNRWTPAELAQEIRAALVAPR